MTDPNKHALLSPSGAGKWMTCPGSLAMEKGEPDKPSEYADEGTCAHSVAAMCLTEGKPATAYVGRRIEVDVARTYEFTEEMADPTQEYVDGVLAMVEGYKLAGAEVTLLVEQRVPVGHITGEEGAEGTADTIVIARWPDRVEAAVRDLKFGRGVRVDAEKNPQLMLYALGALHKHDPLDEAERVVVSVHQPRLNSLSEWACTAEELRDFGFFAGTAAREATAIYNGETLLPGPVGLRAGTHCSDSFCRARHKCPALAAYVVDNVGADFDVIETAQADPKPFVASLVSTTSLGEVGQKLRATDVIEDWIKQVRARAEALLFEHNNSPEAVAAMGFKLVEGRRGNRAWSDETEAEKALKSFRLKQEEMYKFTLISPTQAEKVLKESPRRWVKLEPLISRSEGKPSVAPINDKRPPLELKPVADDFEVLPQGVEDLV